jgi:hypothetical protein
MTGLAVPFARGASVDARQIPHLAQRATGLVLVALLHLLLLLSVLTGLVQPVTRARLMRELTFVLPPLPKARPSPQAGVATAPARRPAPPPLYVLPDAPPSPQETPALPSFGRSLFGCAPERYAEMTQDQRAHCPQQFAMPDPARLSDPPSQVQDPARRQAELAAKNRPFHIPCAAVLVVPDGRAAVPTLDPICVVKGLVDGFGPLSGLPP